ncbi:TetR/AcrR family transcriptional regulator [Paenibacillus sp. GCM10012307]|uniref:TetR/AcrR family transcriptional regulator n=1 Tax=Paenibacillus roseus TaxID=2798579 RepID=A0A934J6S9_9BACL|nr:TetR/AcrR family transcriptional regulator [Paenibacillus roseus]MBJ6364334.1 TetR/AcrR family transcriptional regulator [Paenibacillus roseus]
MIQKETAKERILRVASQLFYLEGVRAVGIDRIIAESGVAKASFYRNFKTKDELVGAYLNLRNMDSLSGIEATKERYPDEPAKQLYGIIERLVSQMREPGFRGCPFINVLVEFPDSAHENHQEAMQCRVEQEREVALIARQAGARSPEVLAAQLKMLYGGAFIEAYTNKSTLNTEYFYEAAKLLIEAQLPAKPSCIE